MSTIIENSLINMSDLDSGDLHLKHSPLKSVCLTFSRLTDVQMAVSSSLTLGSLSLGQRSHRRCAPTHETLSLYLSGLKPRLSAPRREP